MFEKEAIDEVRKIKSEKYYTVADYTNEQMQYFYEEEVALFKDGAEFGYNKANEWHYPSKGELPEKTGRYLILNRFGDHYFTTNITEYLEGAKMFSTFSMNVVYAWKEIILPELKESE